MKAIMHGNSRTAAPAVLTVARSLAAGLLAAGLLAGCATMPPAIPFVPDNHPDRASVTIFRERQFLNGALDTMVRIDRQTVGVLKNGGLLVADAAPGELKIAVQSEYDFRELVLPLQAEPGGDYYVDVLPRQIYLQQFAGGALTLPPEKAAVAACNGKWCIAALSAAEAKSRLPKPAG